MPLPLRSPGPAEDDGASASAAARGARPIMMDKAMKTNQYFSTAALAGFLLATAACSGSAPEDVRAAPANRQHNATPAHDGAAATASPTRHGDLLKEAVDALRETQNALAAIDRGRSDQAIAALERGTGKLEIVLARTPSLALAPVDTAVETRDVLGSVERVQEVREQARHALDRGRLQEARRLIGDLASETVISVSNLPLATYPTALKQAAAALHQGKPQEAKAVLETALSTIVVERTIIPLPLARAEQAIAQAKGLAEKANRTAAENERLRASLAAARTELRFGQALGYATEQDMKDLLAAVDEIERKTTGQQHGTNLLDRIERLFTSARQASQPRNAS